MLPLLVLLAIGDSHGRVDTFRSVVSAMLREEQIDATLFAGDLTSLDEEIPDMMNEINRLKHRAPLIATRGNHDTLENFNDLFGELPQAHDVLDNPFGVTVLSVSDVGSTSGMSFVRRQIEDRPERRFIVLMHVPPLTCSPDSGQTNTATRWRLFLEEVLDSDDLIVSGHNHVTCEYKLNETRVFVTARSGSKRYRCLPEEELPEGATCDDSRDPVYLRIMLMTDGSWSWSWITP